MFNQAIVVKKHINKLSFDLKPMRSRLGLVCRSYLAIVICRERISARLLKN